MTDIITIKGVRGYLDAEGTAHLNLEDVSKGLGFTREANSGNEVIRWETVRKYLSGMGVPTSWHGDSPQIGKAGLPDFIPENIFYRLAMKAKNEAAQIFQALIADEILPSIRKTGGYQTKRMVPEVSPQGLAKLINVTRRVMLDMGSTPQEVAAMVQSVFTTWNVAVPYALAKGIPEQLSLYDLPVLQASV